MLSPRWPEGLPPLRAELHVREHAEVPFVEAALQNRTLEIEIDSGANGGLRIPPDLAAELLWKSEPRPGPLVEAVGDEGRDYMGRLSGRVADEATGDALKAALFAASHQLRGGGAW